MSFRNAQHGPDLNPPRYSSVWRFALLLAVAQACYAAVFIAHSSFVIEGRRYFCLFDDAMVSMRYAANWAAGAGLVWNPGERVEGYSNFAWTAVLALCHLLRWSPNHTVLLVQILGIPTLWACLAATIRLARACRLTPAAACCALVLAMAQYNLNYYTLMGMETGLVALLVTCGLGSAVLAIRRRAGRVDVGLWFGVATLAHPDAVLLLVFVGAMVLALAPARRGRTVLGLAVALLIIAAHALWRHSYYGDWLPNTYYLKATGWPLADRLPVGLRAGLWTMAALGVPVLLAGVSFVRFRSWRLLLAGTFLVSFAYNVWIGGDAWPNGYRFELPATLGLMVLAGDGIWQLSRMLARPKAQIALRIGMCLATVLAVNLMRSREWLLLRAPGGTHGNRRSMMHVMAAERIAGPDATTAVMWAGAFPYFSQRHCFDLLGKCDPHIARLPARPEYPKPGHNKLDPAYTLAKYHPDLVIEISGVAPPEFGLDYRPLVVQVDSTDVVLAVRRQYSGVHGGTPVTWPEASKIVTSLPRD
jgi:hypothetical protein